MLIKDKNNDYIIEESLEFKLIALCMCLFTFLFIINILI